MTRNNERLLRALGICAKAGGLLCGTPIVCEALKSAKPPSLVILPRDNAENSEKRLRDRCRFYQTEWIQIDADGEELAKAVGKTGRLAAVAITDENLCRLVRAAREKDTAPDMRGENQ